MLVVKKLLLIILLLLQLWIFNGDLSAKHVRSIIAPTCNTLGVCEICFHVVKPKYRTETTLYGIDCAGLVLRSYKKLPNYNYKYLGTWRLCEAFSLTTEPKPGDIMLKTGHVMIYAGKSAEGKIMVYESTADGEHGISVCVYREGININIIAIKKLHSKYFRLMGGNYSEKKLYFNMYIFVFFRSINNINICGYK